MSDVDLGVRGFWISVDGVEGAGKTTLAAALAKSLGAEVAPEFSSSLLGQALRAAVQDAPHFISISRIGQSLAFIGDFHETFEQYVAPALSAGKIVISDRGWLSKYAYQAQVLSGAMPLDDIDRLLLPALALPRLPDVTLLLDPDPEIACKRLVARDGACNADRAAFIAGAAPISNGSRQPTAGRPGHN